MCIVYCDVLAQRVYVCVYIYEVSCGRKASWKHEILPHHSRVPTTNKQHSMAYIAPYSPCEPLIFFFFFRIQLALERTHIDTALFATYEYVYSARVL